MTTWNPSDKNSQMILSGGNLVVTANVDSRKSVRATTSASTGKKYYECKVTTGTDKNFHFGMGSSAANINYYCGVDNYGWSWGWNSSSKTHNGNDTSLGTAPLLNDVVMIAWNADLGYLWFGKNNTWFGSGDPANGTNPAFTGVTGTLFPMVSIYTTNYVLTANFSAASFVYTPPTGFVSFEDVGTPSFYIATLTPRLILPRALNQIIIATGLH